MTEEQRALWIRTVLVIWATEPQRRAFIDGYNGGPAPRHSSEIMLRNHMLGQQVYAILNPEPHP